MQRGHFNRSWVILLIAAAAFGALIAWWAQRNAGRVSSTPATQPATWPTTTEAASRPLPPRSYVDVVRQKYPRLPATQPLPVPLDLPDAAHIVLDHPVYVCPRHDLWLTHPDGPAVEDALAKAESEQTHLTRDVVRYVHWEADSAGAWQPIVFVERASGANDARIQAIGQKLRLDVSPQPDAGELNWSRAVSRAHRVFIPATSGVVGIDLAAKSQDYRPLAELRPSTTKTTRFDAASDGAQLVFDVRGLLTWIPSDAAGQGGAGAWRFVDDAWRPLGPEQGWPKRILHLVPLLDGSILQLVVRDDGRVEPVMGLLDGGAVDEATIVALVEQLSDADPDMRAQAFAKLTQYGSGAWPILERLKDDQPPEAQLRLASLLEARATPTLGGMLLIDGRMSVVSRPTDGGAVLYVPGGVRMPRSEQDRVERVVVPAYLSIRPGRPIELLDEDLTRDARPGKRRFFAWADEWAAWDPDEGMRRFAGNHLAPLLHPDEREWSRLLAIDRRGRWLFSADADPRRTLVLDPTLPDVTPKLPAWAIEVAGGKAGWNGDNYPAIHRGGGWMLKESGWAPLKEPTDFMQTEVTPPAIAAATTSRATTNSAAGSPLYIAPDGTRYFGGVEAIEIVSRDGARRRWPLPGEAAGDEAYAPRLIGTSDGLLFLFNRPGRVLRLRPMPQAAEPLELEATFTARVPNSAEPTRIWLDPAGRIVVAYEGNRLTILFPSGRIPSDIATLMPAEQLKE